jgi:hypothetical protein
MNGGPLCLQSAQILFSGSLTSSLSWRVCRSVVVRSCRDMCLDRGRETSVDWQVAQTLSGRATRACQLEYPFTLAHLRPSCPPSPSPVRLLAEKRYSPGAPIDSPNSPLLRVARMLPSSSMMVHVYSSEMSTALLKFPARPARLSPTGQTRTIFRRQFCRRADLAWLTCTSAWC